MRFHEPRFLLMTLAFALALVTPKAAWAFAFSFGTIDASDEIASVVLAPKSGGVPLVSYNGLTGVMSFQADVDQITLVGGTVFDLDPGDVEFSMSTVMLVGGSAVFFPNPFPTILLADFFNGVTFDLAITDVAGGSTVMLEGEFQIPIEMTVTEQLFGVVVGALEGDFDVVGGNGDFVSAWDSLDGSFDAQMASFLVGGVGVLQACSLTSSAGTAGLSCFGVAADGFASWTSNPVVTLQPGAPAVPEPALSILALVTLGSIAAARMRQ